MAINSFGYPNLIAPGSVLASMTEAWGHRYSAAGFSDFRVTLSGSGTRRVNIAAGWALGKGVQVQNTAATTFEFAAPSGTSQWFLLGLKRWQTNPAYDPEAVAGTPESSPYISQIVSVAGTSSRAVPAVTQDAGSNDTQWLALCRVASSSTLVQEVVDLRLVSGEGGAGYEVYSDLAMDQLDDIIGARVYRADTINGHKPSFYENITTTSGAASWKNVSRQDEKIQGSTESSEEALAGWGRQGTSTVIRRGDLRTINMTVRQFGNELSADANGRIGGETLLLRMLSTDRPAPGQLVALAAYVQSDAGILYGGSAQLGGDGIVRFTSTDPGAGVREITVSGTYSTS